MSYTIKNLSETKDSAPEFGYGEIQEAHFPAKELEAEKTGLAFYFIRPGRRQPFAHRHEQAEEIYVVLAGSGRIKLDEETAEIKRLDAVRVAPGVLRTFEAGPEGMELLAFGSRHERDGELVREDVWGD
jgi:mannose-6-phosphate isomerase-like protein (cupin superfamily)